MRPALTAAGLRDFASQLEEEADRQGDGGFDEESWQAWLSAWRDEVDAFNSDHGVRLIPPPGSFAAAGEHLSNAAEALLRLAAQHGNQLGGNPADVGEARDTFRNAVERAELLLADDGFIGPRNDAGS